jgi:hypothetical protein
LNAVVTYRVAAVSANGSLSEWSNLASITNPKEFEGYTLTQFHYSETADLDAAVRAEFGDLAEVADWNEIKQTFSGRATAFANGIGLTQYDVGVLLYRGGGLYWSGNRHYFMARHDGKLPDTYTFLVHDDIDNHVLDLGSWYGLSMRVLVKLGSASGI